MKTEAQKKAQKKYELKNKERTTYGALKRNAFNFACPAPGSKSETATNWAHEQYLKDLSELKALLDSKLN